MEEDKNRVTQVKELLERTRKYIPISLILLSSVLVGYVFFMGVPVSLLLFADPFLVALALGFQLSSFLILAGRLRLVSSVSNVEIGWETLLFKLTETFSALITPAGFGALLLRAYFVKTKGAGWDKGMGIAWSTFFIDIICNNIVGIFYALPYLGTGNPLVIIPILLIPFLTIALYAALLIISNNKDLREKASTFTHKIKMDIEKESIKDFGSVFRDLLHRPVHLTGAVLLTVLKILLQACAVICSAWALGETILFDHALTFQAFSYVMQNTPLPGGAIAVEYAVSLVSTANIVVLWRFVTFHLTLVVCLLPFHYFTKKHFEADDVSSSS